MGKSSLDAFRRTVTVSWPAHQDKTAKDLLLRTSADGHGKIMRDQTSRAGVPPDFDAYANRVGNSDLKSVVLPGPIVYRYRYHKELVKVLEEALRMASPVVSGLYSKSHEVYLNGTRVELDSMPMVKESDEVMIVNVLPYARKIEVGKTRSGRSFVVQVPDHIYQRVGASLRQRYGKVFDIRMTFVNLSDAYRLRSPSTGRRSRRPSRSSSLTYPAIVFKQRV